MIVAIEAALVEAIRDRLRNGRCTEVSLSLASGVSQPHVSHVLAGKRHAPAEVLSAIAGAAGISWDELSTIAEECARRDREQRQAIRDGWRASIAA